MTILYNCRRAGEAFRISKFDDAMNVESSYLCTLSTCDCPAGVRPMCRHREMLPKFIQREHIGDEWFFDFNRGGWVQMDGEWAEQGISGGEDREMQEALEAIGEPELPAPTKPKALFIRRRI